MIKVVQADHRKFKVQEVPKDSFFCLKFVSSSKYMKPILEKDLDGYAPLYRIRIFRRGIER